MVIRILQHLIRRPNLFVCLIVSTFLLGILKLTLPQLALLRAILWSLNFAMALYLIWSVRRMVLATPFSMRQLVQVQMQRKWWRLGSSVLLCIALMAALYIELHASKTKSNADVLLASCTIVLAWFYLAMLFAQEYAYHFYAEGERGGLLFPATPEPDYSDFMYFSLVLSMAFQVSDVSITSRPIRHIVLLHSVAAFFFNVVIVSITVSILGSVF